MTHMGLVHDKNLDTSVTEWAVELVADSVKNTHVPLIELPALGVVLDTTVDGVRLGTLVPEFVP